jgi:hypothetical protein
MPAARHPASLNPHLSTFSVIMVTYTVVYISASFWLFAYWWANARTKEPSPDKALNACRFTYDLYGYTQRYMGWYFFHPSYNWWAAGRIHLVACLPTTCLMARVYPLRDARGDTATISGRGVSFAIRIMGWFPGSSLHWLFHLSQCYIAQIGNTIVYISRF